MAVLTWDASGSRLYETGVSKGVLFTRTGSNGAYAKGVAWNGLTSVSENPTGADSNALYADNIKYLNLVAAEEFEGSIEAYTYPDAFGVCDGSVELVANSGVTVGQQPRKQFAICYQTKIGDDTTPERGYKIHILYGLYAAPSEKSYESINDSPEAITFSWDVSSTPVEVTKVSGITATSIVVIDSTKIPEAKLKQITDSLYGTDAAGGSEGTESTLLLPDDIFDILSAT